MNSYEFAMKPVVHAGRGSLQTLREILTKRGIERPILITDRNLAMTAIPERVRAVLPACAVFDGVTPDPHSEDITAALEAIATAQADGVIAVGGGSSIDVAKLAGLLAYHEETLEQVAQDWTRAPHLALPLIAVPTTVGSGSEMTRGAVFVDSRQEIKRVVIADSMAATDVLLDPELLSSLPSAVTASTGADALTQAIEGVLSTARTAFTDALHLQAIGMIHAALPPAVQSAADTEAMGSMQEAAAMVGAGLAYSGVGAAHALANVLGGHYPIPHGVACAVMLCPVLIFNAEGVSAGRYQRIAHALGLHGVDTASAPVAVVQEVSRLLSEVHLNSRLREYEVPRAALHGLAVEAADHTDMATNPRAATSEAMLAILEEVW